jgi:hypothetical protein
MGMHFAPLMDWGESKLPKPPAEQVDPRQTGKTFLARRRRWIRADESKGEVLADASPRPSYSAAS